MSMLINIACLKTIQKLFTLLGGCINIILKSPHIKKFCPTEDRYTNRLKNSSQNASEYEPGGRLTKTITKAGEPVVIAIFSKDL